MSDTKRAVVVGASSGIGEALARRLAADGYEVGLCARRRDRLVDIGDDLPTKAYVARIDVTDTEDAREGFSELTDAMGSVDLVVVNAGVGYENRELDPEQEHATVATNALGYTTMAVAAMRLFEEQGHGHLVGISSLAAHFPNGATAAYNASKAFVTRYTDGLRYRARGLDADVAVTVIEPGFVDTDLAGGDLWKCSPETAADHIIRAVRKEKRHAYVTRRWRVVAWLFALMPDALARRLFG
ncbi:SDR family NAD(P)-dependent oxidoreductase [Halosegnis marinus]|uniref:SDR family NAD(P)-dependent oxidoreductase n=1 Tax=Halosegnis marinus TaxID=3034023 RepID=A0ABD5ZQN7_9EURY|nr:SDR family NAD(P)-dependent oxidoreductase [Halosegnis sp. DT85]